MSENSNSKKITIIITVALAVGAYLIYSGVSNEATIIANSQAAFSDDVTKPRTIADAWQENVKYLASTRQVVEQVKNNQDTYNDGVDTPFVLDYPWIHQEIGKIRLSEDGDVIIDGIALNALRKALSRNKDKITPEIMSEIVGILKAGLPGVAGEQASELVSNFHEFLLAKSELSAAYSDIHLNGGNAQQGLEEEKSLRNLYLGEALAEQLFKKEDQQSDYMYKVFKIAASKDLTKEEKIIKRAELTKSHFTPDIHNWHGRYGNYREKLDTILSSGIVDKEKDAEINHLKTELFTQEELNKISDSNISLKS